MVSYTVHYLVTIPEDNGYTGKLFKEREREYVQGLVNCTVDIVLAPEYPKLFAVTVEGKGEWYDTIYNSFGLFEQIMDKKFGFILTPAKRYFREGMPQYEPLDMNDGEDDIRTPFLETE